MTAPSRSIENRALRDHQEWIGYLQPVGLVVTAPALLAAGVNVDRNITVEQEILRGLALRRRLPNRRGESKEAVILTDLPAFAARVLDWRAEDLAGAPGGPELPASLDLHLTEYAELVRPTYGVPDPEKPGEWLLLIQEVPTGLDLDARWIREGHLWEASPQARFERLLRERNIPVGLLFNGIELRLTYAPAGESSGHMTFPIAALCEASGRSILSALQRLLHAERLFVLPEPRRLRAILKQSRLYQNEVSTRLAEQVLSALWELLRGFQLADEISSGELLREWRREMPEEIYGGLLATILRLVFVLYAEDRGVMPTDPVYVENYSMTGLFDRLREDAARHPDTMDQRFGAWAQLLVLFRMVHDGAAHGAFQMPARDGKLFNPDTYPFLEGRPLADARQSGVHHLRLPRVPDGAIYRVLQNLLLLDGERLSYRALDVEQIGSVYQAMMGFTLSQTTGHSIAVRVKKVDVVIDLDALLAEEGAARKKAYETATDLDLSGKPLDAVKVARMPEALVAALGKKVSHRTPAILPPESLYLQPTEERRRSGSHYTPRSLTGPIVRTTLRPIFEAFVEQNGGTKPTPEQILSLKICDPAVGSGAFLVETCRYLGDELAEAWQRTHTVPRIPDDEDLILHARREVAQKCLYGIDRNRFAVYLAKLSLWLVTLAKDHPFTFLDHAIREGDSLVGLSREQIACFNLETSGQLPLLRPLVDATVKEALALREQIRGLSSSDDTDEKRRLLKEADDALANVRAVGDAVIAAFFLEEKDKERQKRRQRYSDVAMTALHHKDFSSVHQIADELGALEYPVKTFHWEVEFPEVFDPKNRSNPGFDAFVGNPPFGQKNIISQSNASSYLPYLLASFVGVNGKSDLCGYFFRQVFGQLRRSGCAGLIATNTISQGDTRAASLSWMLNNEGVIFAATRRIDWPGAAAVVASSVCFRRGSVSGPILLDGKVAPRISAFLVNGPTDDDPSRLSDNAGISHHGIDPSGKGFTFDDAVAGAHPIAEMHALVANHPDCATRIFPYIGGEEINSSPTLEPRRFVIALGKMTEEEAWREVPDLMILLERSVKRDRESRPANVQARYLAAKWWQWHSDRPRLQAELKSRTRVLVSCQVGPHLSFVFQPSNRQFSLTLNVFTIEEHGGFCVLQSRPHEIWARFFGSSLKDDLRYTTSDCFETFPFPAGWRTNLALEMNGQDYHGVRARLLPRFKGLTATYNRFHDPEERDSDILKLRELHDAMDRAVLDAYGWSDIRPTCEFLLDYEEEESAEEAEGKRRKKKPWRYRWPDEIRDEVLARLIALNAERAEEERRAGVQFVAAAGGDSEEGGEEGQEEELSRPAQRGRKKK